MRSGVRNNRHYLFVHFALLAAALATYLFSPQDIVWSFVKSSPNARVLEHAGFGAAAALLGFALLLNLHEASLSDRKQPSSPLPQVIASLCQAAGIGSLLPLAGFLVLVVGEVGATLYFAQQQQLRTFTNPTANDHLPRARTSIAGRLSDHIGLCCAFVSMTVFSIVLVDRVATVLFSVTALLSLAADLRRS